MTPTVTLNTIHAHRPCRAEWDRGLALVGKTEPDDEPISIRDILDQMGLDAALWCLRALPVEWDAEVRLLACDLADPAMQYTADPRPQAALDTARAYARGEATEDELAAAADAAWAAENAAWAARDAAWAAAWAAEAAAEARATVALAAAEAAAARAAAEVATWDARQEQEAILRRWLDEQEGGTQ